MYYVPDWWIWKVFCLDRKTRPGTVIINDITYMIDLPASRFKPTTSAKKVESFFQTKRIKGLENLEIRELMEVWAGWVDANGFWQKVQFGGYIIGLHGSGPLNDHVLTADLVDYSILADKTTVFAWPTPLNESPILGYPPDYSAKVWLQGKKGLDGPYDGILPSHLNHIKYKIDDIFDEAILIADAIPGIPYADVGNDYSLGQFGFTHLKPVIEDLANVSNYVNRALRPSWWFAAVPDGRLVRPQFTMVDLNDLSKYPRYTLATDADESIGEILISADAEHSRDARSVMTLVTTKGRGGPTLASEISDWVYAVAFNQDHMDYYPTYYQKPQPLHDGRLVVGWGGPPIIDSRIDTIRKAQDIADQYEEQVWGPIANITGRMYEPIETGDVVIYRDPDEGLNQAISMSDVDVETNDGLFIYKYTSGSNPISIEDVLKAGTSDFPLLSGDSGKGMGGANRGPGGRSGGMGMHGAPRPTNIDGNPSGRHQNDVQSTNPSIPGISQYPAKDRSPDPNSTVWKPQHQTHDTAGNVTDFHDGKTGTKAGEWHLSFGTNGTRFITFRSAYSLVSQIISDPQFNTGVSILYYLHKSGTATTTYEIQGTPTEFSPIKVGFGDKLKLVVTGVNRTVGLAVILSTIVAKHDENGNPIA